MKLYILFSFLLLSVLCSSHVDAHTNKKPRVKFGALCSGNPSNKIGGCGKSCRFFSWFRRKHLGIDIVCADGATVYAPFDVKLIGKAVPYPNNTKIEPINDGIHLTGEGLCFKLFYVKPDKISGTAKKGEKIGTMLPMQKVYPGTTSHVRVQMCDRSDPTKYF